MPYISKASRRGIALFLLALLCAFVGSMLIPSVYPVGQLGTALYMLLLIAWGLTVRRRIVQKTMRRSLLAALFFLLLLFFLRSLRFSAASDTRLDLLLWYGYYVPFTAAPLLFLFCVVSIGKTEQDRLPRWGGVLWGLWGVLVLLILTNDLHGLAFSSETALSANNHEYGPLYFLALIWIAGLTTAAMAVMIRRTMISQCRRLLWIPLIPLALASVLLWWYYMVGGSPELFGRKLFNLQEVVAFGFVAFWECCIQIGLVPSNSGYAEIFGRSTLHAEITDTGLKTVYSAETPLGLSPQQKRYVLSRPLKLDNGLRVQSAEISGGAVFWGEDVSAVDRLTQELSRTNARIARENAMLSRENEIKAKKMEYEIKTRLYDSISQAVAPQIAKIDALLRPGEGGPQQLHAAIAESAVLAAYVKRRANLTLLSENNADLSVEELHASIAESLDILELTGVKGSVSVSAAPENLPARVVILCYDFFEAVVECALPAAQICMVRLEAGEGAASFGIMLDAAAALPDPARWSGALSACNMTLTTDQEDGVYFKLRYDRGASHGI